MKVDLGEAQRRIFRSGGPVRSESPTASKRSPPRRLSLLFVYRGGRMISIPE
jgi:hypothetical protein